jgi:hypothetical protein
MASTERLSEIDTALDAFGVSADKLAACVALAAQARMPLAEVDAALTALAERFETRVPDGLQARSGSWRRPGAARDAGDAVGEVGIGEVGIGEVGIGEVGIGEVGIGEVGIGEVGVDVAGELDTSLLPAALSEPPPRPEPPSEVRSNVAEEGSPLEKEERSFASDASALELELESESPPPRAARPSSSRDGAAAVSRSVPPPALLDIDLDADLASILAEELGPSPSADTGEGDELAAEPTALFSADLFGAGAEPSLDGLLSEAALEGEELESLEIDLDDSEVFEEAQPASPPPLPGLEALPVEAGPVPAQAGFLGRLLNRKG